MQGSKIDTYGKLVTEYQAVLEKLEVLLNEPDFQKQRDELTEEDEWYGFVYGDLGEMLKSDSESF